MLNKIKIWIQIHDLPDLFFHLIKSLAGTVGEFIYAEQKSQDFKVKIDVTKPLKNVVSLVIKKKREIFIVKYERLPDWCAVCGHLGHLFKECGNGIHPPLALVFKGLRVEWFRGPGRGPGEGRGGGGNRGRGRSGRGAGRGSPQYDNNTWMEEEENVDQLLDATMVDADRNRKRGAGQTTEQTASLPGSTPAIMGGENNALALIPASVPQSPSSKQEPKRNKPSPSVSEKAYLKSSSGNKTNDARLAGLQGGRLAQ